MKPLHILRHPLSEMVQVPLVLYVSEDLMLDEGTTPESIAELLTKDVAFGIEEQRDEMEAEAARKEQATQ